RFAWKDKPALYQAEIRSWGIDLCTDAVTERRLYQAQSMLSDALRYGEVVGQRLFKSCEASYRIQGLALHCIKHSINGKRFSERGVRYIGQQAVTIYEIRDKTRPEIGKIDVVRQAESQANLLLIKIGKALFQAIIGEHGIIIKDANDPSLRNPGSCNQFGHLW